VGADFKLVTRSLVDVRRTQNVVTLNAGRQRDRALDDSAGTLGGIDDLECRLIDQTVIECLQADTDFLVWSRLWCGRHVHSLKERAASEMLAAMSGGIAAAA